MQVLRSRRNTKCNSTTNVGRIDNFDTGLKISHCRWLKRQNIAC